MPSVPALGRRGEGWVAAQFTLMAVIVPFAVLGPPWPEDVDALLAVLGAALAVAGALVVIWAGRALGKSLTPFPSPAPSGQLVVRGPYRVVRHPIYAGGVLFFVGLALATSPAALAPTALLIVVWGLKLTVEERFLRTAYAEYQAYCATTRHRLVPFVF